MQVLLSRQTHGLILIVVLCIACMVGAGCAFFGGSSSSASGSQPGAKIGRDEAIKIAVDFLSKEGVKQQYITEDPMVTESDDTVKKWLVVFKRVNWETARPSRGIVIIDKQSGIPRWVPTEE